MVLPGRFIWLPPPPLWEYDTLVMWRHCRPCWLSPLSWTSPWQQMEGLQRSCTLVSEHAGHTCTYTNISNISTYIMGPTWEGSDQPNSEVYLEMVDLTDGGTESHWASYLYIQALSLSDLHIIVGMVSCVHILCVCVCVWSLCRLSLEVCVVPPAIMSALCSLPPGTPLADRTLVVSEKVAMEQQRNSC